VVAPAVVAGLVPWWLTGWRMGSTYPVPVRVAGGVVIAAGAAVLIGAFAQFAVDGLGTPAPVAPTDGWWCVGFTGMSAIPCTWRCWP